MSISFLPSPLNTHSHIHTQTLVSILRENLQEWEDAVIQQVREEERARRGIDNLIKAEKEAAKQRYKRLILKEVDDEVELLMHHTRRGYNFHPTSAPPLPPQNTVSVFLNCPACSHVLTTFAHKDGKCQ